VRSERFAPRPTPTNVFVIKCSALLMVYAATMCWREKNRHASVAQCIVQLAYASLTDENEQSKKLVDGDHSLKKILTNVCQSTNTNLKKIALHVLFSPSTCAID